MNIKNIIQYKNYIVREITFLQFATNEKMD